MGLLVGSIGFPDGESVGLSVIRLELGDCVGLAELGEAVGALEEVLAVGLLVCSSAVVVFMVGLLVSSSWPKTGLSVGIFEG